ncbi:hypothetical protein AHiyo6_14920 [Arthrobacter sp. Hiyo6]|nr:hypothetical protein AHiyo6_14920 [Arthrobacter sp. Hiyo6]
MIRQTRIYRRRILLSGFAAGGICVVIYAMTAETLLLPLSVLVLVGLWYGCFFLANHEIRAAKAAGGWYKDLHQASRWTPSCGPTHPDFPGSGWHRR